MKTAIIPDVHQELIKVQHILRAINALGVTKKVFLGDWFDSFTSIHDHAETAEFLRDLIETDPECTFIFGNHDLPYAFNPKVCPCPGFNWNNKIDIQRYLQQRHWNKFVLATKVGSYWCSHAGMHPSLSHPVYGLSDENIIHKCREALLDTNHNNNNPWMSWGEDRGGDLQQYGGIVWLDFNKSFVPIDGMNQIIGHSVAWKPRHIWTDTSDNWCIDTKLDHFLIIDDETNEVKLYSTYGIEIDVNNERYVAGRKYVDGFDKLFLKNSANDLTPTVKRII